VGVETGSFQKWLKYYLDKAKKEQRLYYETFEIKRDRGIRKWQRHERIIYPLRNRKIYVAEDDPELPYICQELREYPRSHNDHFLDTLTDFIEIARPPVIRKKIADGYRLPPTKLNTRSRFQTGYSFRHNSAL
jgi:hypothetical protein